MRPASTLWGITLSLGIISCMKAWFSTKSQFIHVDHRLQVRRILHVHCSSVPVAGQSNFMTKSGFTTKGSGRKTTFFGTKFRRPTGKTSYLRKSSKRPCKRMSTGSFPLRRFTKSLLSLGRSGAFRKYRVDSDVYAL